MAKTAEEWKDAYYEQQALHTEARGMLCQERDGYKAEVERLSSLLSKETCRADDLVLQVGRLQGHRAVDGVELEKLRSYAGALEKALEFYAKPAHWVNDSVDIGVGSQTIPESSVAANDRGYVAQQAFNKRPQLGQEIKGVIDETATFTEEQLDAAIKCLPARDTDKTCSQTSRPRARQCGDCYQGCAWWPDKYRDENAVNNLEKP